MHTSMSNSHLQSSWTLSWFRSGGPPLSQLKKSSFWKKIRPSICEEWRIGPYCIVCAGAIFESKFPLVCCRSSIVWNYDNLNFLEAHNIECILQCRTHLSSLLGLCLGSEVEVLHSVNCRSQVSEKKLDRVYVKNEELDLIVLFVLGRYSNPNSPWSVAGPP